MQLGMIDARPVVEYQCHNSSRKACSDDRVSTGTLCNGPNTGEDFDVLTGHDD